MTDDTPDSDETEPITLVELLRDDDTEFTLFKDGEERDVQVDNPGTAIDILLDRLELDVGLNQRMGPGTRPVYLSIEGMLETLLDEIPADGEVVVDEGKAHLAHGLLQYEVEKLKAEPHPEQDIEQYKRARDHFGEVLDDE